MFRFIAFPASRPAVREQRGEREAGFV